MINKKLAKKLFAKGEKMATIAKDFKVSNQRIFAIVKNYKHTGKRGRLKKYKNIDKCEICGIKSATLLHHKDFINENDNDKNLQSLCHNCHVLIHKKISQIRISFVKKEKKRLKLLYQKKFEKKLKSTIHRKEWIKQYCRTEKYREKERIYYHKHKKYAQPAS
jgi:hypothetical protein